MYIDILFYQTTYTRSENMAATLPHNLYSADATQCLVCALQAWARMTAPATHPPLHPPLTTMSVTHRFSQLGLQTQASSSSLLNGAVTTLAEANPGQADARLLDYLSIEVCPDCTDELNLLIEWY